MKNRTTPYGYMYENGNIVVNPNEEKSVKGIFMAYLDGMSLKNIAAQLNANKIEYLPGITGWNKARLMRLIEDKRYIGNDTYPAIVEQTVYNAVINLKAEKNTLKDIDRSAEIFKLAVPVKCPKCNNLMHRHTDNRRKVSTVFWKCENEMCKTIINITDDVLLKEITKSMNTVILNPEIISETLKQELQADIIGQKLQNEITKMLWTVELDKEELKAKMFEYASEKYQSIDNEEYLIRRMKTDFEKSKLLSDFSADLVNKTVKSITIKDNRSISVELMNGQTIGKEKASDDRNNLQSTVAA